MQKSFVLTYVFKEMIPRRLDMTFQLAGMSTSIFKTKIYHCHPKIKQVIAKPLATVKAVTYDTADEVFLETLELCYWKGVVVLTSTERSIIAFTYRSEFNAIDE